VFGVALREPRHDATGTQTPPDPLYVITTVASHALGPMLRTTPLSLQRWDGVNECESLLRVVPVGAGELNGQRNSAPIADQMTLAAEFGSVARIGACLKPPKTARIELLSRTARDQSICP
jgi:hypothetical protein